MGDGEQQLVAAFHDFLGLSFGLLSGATGTVTFIHIADYQYDEDDDKC